MLIGKLHMSFCECIEEDYELLMSLKKKVRQIQENYKYTPTHNFCEAKGMKVSVQVNYQPQSKRQ